MASSDLKPGRCEADGGFRAWAWCLLALLLCLPPLFAGLRRADTTFHMEVITLLSSQETWLRQQAGEEHAWLMPTWNGNPRIEKPPLAVWCNLLAWRGLDPATAAPEELVFRARAMGIALCLLALAALFYVVRRRDGLDMAALTTLATGTCFLFIREARMASYDTYLLAFVTLGIAAGLFAVMPPGTRAPHWTGRLLGWLVSGLALGAGVLAKGPLAIPLQAGTLALLICWQGRAGRAGRLTGLAFSVALAIALAAPWFYYAYTHVPGALERLIYEYRAVQHDRQSAFYYLQVFGWVAPWTLWLAGGLAVPILETSAARRQALWPAWLWFAGVVLALSLPDAKHQRYIVAVLPAVGWLVAQAWLRHTASAQATGRHGWIRLHWGLLFAATTGLFLFAVFQGRLLAWHVLKQPEMADLRPLVVTAVCAALAACAWLGRRWHLQGRALPAAAACAAWMSLAGALLYHGYSAGRHGQYASRAEVMQVLARVGGNELRYLRPPDGDSFKNEPDQKFLFYARRIVPAATPADLPALCIARRPVYLMVQARRELESLASQAGFQRVMEFRDDVAARGLFVNRAGQH